MKSNFYQINFRKKKLYEKKSIDSLRFFLFKPLAIEKKNLSLAEHPAEEADCEIVFSKIST